MANFRLINVKMKLDREQADEAIDFAMVAFKKRVQDQIAMGDYEFLEDFMEDRLSTQTRITIFLSVLRDFQESISKYLDLNVRAKLEEKLEKEPEDINTVLKMSKVSNYIYRPKKLFPQLGYTKIKLWVKTAKNFSKLDIPRYKFIWIKTAK